ncbi:MAG: hypothetical protein IMZ55_08525, partial [Acidobacteria bacterium]|nr:hypothetical protein [Acidobacteriota bacterium]
MRHLIGPVLLAAAVAAGCCGKDEAAPADAARAAMTALHEAAGAAARAEARGPVTWYTRENLYDYIDGQAEEYFGAGFVLLGHTEWKPSGTAGDAYVELDLYDMGSPDGVAKVMPPPPGDKTVE